MNTLCEVCHDDAREIYGDFHWNIQGTHYRLVKCRSCGSVHTDPLPDNAMLLQLYKTFNYRWYRDHYDAKLRDSRIRVSEYRNAMGRRVLDFGGGIGYFSTAARELGFESRTFDPFYEKESGIPKNWDTIVALHVLEHSNTIDTLLEQMKGLLKPGGNIIIAVPNFLSQGYKQLGMNWVWAQPPLLHIFHFTSSGLQALLSRHGFRDFKVSHHERWDANLYTDLEHVQRFKKMDAAWFRMPFTYFPFYRKKIAKRNAAERFKGLEQAMKNYSPDNCAYAELQVIAKVPLIPSEP